MRVPSPKSTSHQCQSRDAHTVLPPPGSPGACPTGKTEGRHRPEVGQEAAVSGWIVGGWEKPSAKRNAEEEPELAKEHRVVLPKDNAGAMGTGSQDWGSLTQTLQSHIRESRPGTSKVLS